MAVHVLPHKALRYEILVSVSGIRESDMWHCDTDSLSISDLLVHSVHLQTL